MKRDNEDKRYREAQKQVKALRGFYMGLLSYAVFISALAGLNYYVDRWQYPWFLWPALGWGIGLFFQGMKVFKITPVFGKEWERRKLNQFLSEDQSGNMTFEPSKKQSTMAYLRAEKKVETLKGFYQHLISYCIINAALILYFVWPTGNGNWDFSQWGTYSVAFFWGIGLLWHAVYVFYSLHFNNKFLKKWEENKIKQLMEDDRF